MPTMPRTEFTANQLLALPRGRQRFELLRGELHSMSPAGWLHGTVAARVLARLDAHVELHGLGVVFAAETGCLLEHAPDTVRAADAAFVSQSRLASVARRSGFFPGAPDLAVEVLSPSDVPAHVREKVACWLAAGCRIVWVIDPERRCGEVHRPGVPVEELGEHGVFRGEALLPGFELVLREALLD